MHRFAQLQAVNVEGVPPALRADLSDDNVTRPDEAVQYQDRCHDQTERACKCLPVCSCDLMHCVAYLFNMKGSTMSPFMCRDGLLKEVPEMEGEFVKVPKIL